MSTAVEVRDMIKANEGVRLAAYKDSLGILTVGVGFNLQRLDARARCAMHGVNFDDVKAGCPITMAQCDALLDEDIDACVASLRDLFPKFHDMPVPAQMVLIDMRFQLGAGGLKAFKNTLAAFRSSDWKLAAAGLRTSLAYKQTPRRWERNAAALEALK